MEHCKYHPRESSRWYCERCDSHYCNQCVEKDVKNNKARCFSCGEIVHKRMSSEYITPFWRKLSEIHRYPLSSTPLVAMLTTAFLATVLMHVPLYGIAGLILTFVLYMGYCSEIMLYTANGNLTHPKINQFFEPEGRRLVLLQIAYFVGMGVFTFLLGSWLGYTGTVIGSILPTLIFPAALILAVVDDRFSSMINPLRLLSVAFSIGPAYPLLLIFMLLIGGSQQVVLSIVGADNIFGTALIFLVVCYFSMVSYHLVGYAIFQYHDELDYFIRTEVTDDHDGEGTSMVNIDSTNALNRAQVLIKEGKPHDAAAGLMDAAQRHPDNLQLQETTYKVLGKVGSPEQRLRHGEGFTSVLMGQGHLKKAALMFADLVRLDKDFKPTFPDKYHDMARLLQQMGKPREALALLNGFNEYFPDHPDEIRNYLLAVEILLVEQPQSPVIDSVLNYLEDGEEDEEILKQVAMLRARAARLRGQQATG